MRTIPFERSPEHATIGDGLSIGARYWAGSWDRWLLAVVAVGLANGLVSWLLPPSPADTAAIRSMLVGGTVDASRLPSLLAGPLAIVVVGLVADWFLTANAVAGLRGREVTLAWVLGAGLRALLVLLAVSFLLMVVLSLLLALGAPGVLAALALVPVAVYGAIRFAFWELALFDGAGLEGSLRRSWALTNGAALRVLGWALVLMGLSLGLSIAETVAGLLVARAEIATSVLGGLVSAAFQAYTVIVIAVLYESQQRRAAVAGPRSAIPGA